MVGMLKWFIVKFKNKETYTLKLSTDTQFIKTSVVVIFWCTITISFKALTQGFPFPYFFMFPRNIISGIKFSDLGWRIMNRFLYLRIQNNTPLTFHQS